MDVTLHFGAHRTATTTFQRMMGASGPALREVGLAYWGPKRTRSDLFSGLLGTSDPVLPWVRRRAARPGKRVALAMSALADRGMRKLLVSEENMLGAMRPMLARRRLYPDAAARMRALAPVFGPECRRIGLAIRSYDAWWTSAIAFSLARGGPLPSSGLVRDLLAQDRRWRDVITELAAAFPEAEICVWSHEMMSATPERVAEALIGPGLPPLTGMRDWHNPAPSPAALRGHLADLGHDPHCVREAVGRFMPFDGPARRGFQAQYADDLAWLKAGAGPGITYIDDAGPNPVATGRGRGSSDDGELRRLA